VQGSLDDEYSLEKIMERYTPKNRHKENARAREIVRRHPEKGGLKLVKIGTKNRPQMDEITLPIKRDRDSI
jgi:hypothetical protein